MQERELSKGVATGVPDDPEGQWGTDGGQNQLRPRGGDQKLLTPRGGVRPRR